MVWRRSPVQLRFLIDFPPSVGLGTTCGSESLPHRVCPNNGEDGKAPDLGPDPINLVLPTWKQNPADLTLPERSGLGMQSGRSKYTIQRWLPPASRAQQMWGSAGDRCIFASASWRLTFLLLPVTLGLLIQVPMYTCGCHFFVFSVELSSCRPAHHPRATWASHVCRNVTFWPFQLILALAGPWSAHRPCLYPLEWISPHGFWAAQGLEGPAALRPSFLWNLASSTLGRSPSTVFH